ncbi:zinc finger, CCHC-type containing protein, partial [Tanacetum coccineum]
TRMYTVKKVTVTDSPTDSDKSGPSFSGTTLYAKLVIGEPSRKSVDFRTLLAPAGNGANVATSLESVRAIAISKFGLVKSMLNLSSGLFFFQFSSNDGMDAMLENRPWFIRNNLFILKNWDPDVNLLKEDDGSVLVKLCLSNDCLRADAQLKDTIMVAMPKIVHEGVYMCTIRVDYEWKPP